jgi:hypothetical protein
MAAPGEKAMKSHRVSSLVLILSCSFAAVRCGEDRNPAAPEAAVPNAALGGGTASSASAGAGVATAMAAQPWTIQDACSDGKGMRVRLWEAIGLQLTGRYTRIFQTKSNTGTVRFNLLCTKGRSACVGGTTNPVSSTVWGVGLNAEKKAAKPFCRVCSATAANVRLLCPKRVDGGLDLVLEEGDFASDLGASSSSDVEDEGTASFDGE